MKTPHIKPPTSIDTAALLGRGRTLAARGAAGSNQHDQLVQQTEKWVAQTFYGTLLKQMRQSPFHSDLMDGGNGGKTFQSMLDQRLADHMSRHAGGKLVRAIVKKIESAQAAKHYAKASKSSSPKGAHPSSSLKPDARTPALLAPAKHYPHQLHRIHVHMENKEHA